MGSTLRHGWRAKRRAIVAAVLVSATVGACGGNARQDAKEPIGNFPVQVTSASFPTSQRISQHSKLLLRVRNSGNRTIPDIAVTICNVTCTYPARAGEGTSAEPFAEYLKQPYLANPSRPVWIVDHPPDCVLMKNGTCAARSCGYSCQSGGAGGAATAYANTWALGPLKPGGVATFSWAVTAVRPGRHVIMWVVAAGLNGKARAVQADGSRPQGTFAVKIAAAPSKSYVNDAGQVITTK